MIQVIVVREARKAAGFDLEAQLYGDAMLPKSGMITVPQGPGLGCDPDADVVRNLQVRS